MGSRVEVHKGSIRRAVNARRPRKRMLGTITLSDNEFGGDGNIFHIAEIEAEAVTGEVAVGIQRDSSVDSVNIPNPAVVVEVQHQAHAGPARKPEDWNSVVVALAARQRGAIAGARRGGGA